MPYSHLGAPALGFDLVRLDAGERVATVLRSGLAVGASDLDGLAAAHPGAAARESWTASWQRLDPAHGRALRDVLPLAGEAISGAAEGDTRLLRRLELSLVGDSPALERFVRREVLDWTWVTSGSTAVQDPAATPAADVLSDAAVSAYLQEHLATDVRRAMAAPLLRSGLTLTSSPGGTGVPLVDERLEVLAGADDSARQRWRVTVDRLRLTTGEWAPAMHQAAWALVTSERLRLATDVQLAGVQAFRRGGFSPQDAAYGVWNAVAGSLQAGVVADLLPAAVEQVLTRPWRSVYEEDAAPPTSGEEAL
jgi:hypothetical protein